MAYYDVTLSMVTLFTVTIKGKSENDIFPDDFWPYQHLWITFNTIFSQINWKRPYAYAMNLKLLNTASPKAI